MRRVLALLGALLGRVLIVLLTIYKRVVSPLLPPACRFYPTCSVYAVDAVKIHGPLQGMWLATRRVGRCHPFHPGGHDPVPPRRESAAPSDDAGARTPGA